LGITSFTASMRELDIKSVFAFDPHYQEYGITAGAGGDVLRLFNCEGI
jgi:predicted nucleic acid-binding protein